MSISSWITRWQPSYSQFVNINEADTYSDHKEANKNGNGSQNDPSTKREKAKAAPIDDCVIVKGILDVKEFV